jgi:hypothetical protein
MVRFADSNLMQTHATKRIYDDRIIEFKSLDFNPLPLSILINFSICNLQMIGQILHIFGIFILLLIPQRVNLTIVYADLSIIREPIDVEF